MKKQTLALALVTAITSGAAFANNNSGCEIIDGKQVCLNQSEGKDAKGDYKRTDITVGSPSGDVKELVTDKEYGNESRTEIHDENGTTVINSQTDGEGNTLISDESGENFVVIDNAGNQIAEGGDAALPDNGVDDTRRVDLPDQRVDGPSRSEIIERADRNEKNTEYNRRAIEDAEREQNRDNQHAAEEIGNNRDEIKRIQNDATKWDQQASKEWDSASRSIDSKFNSQQDQISSNRAKISENSARIDNLENAFMQQGEAMKERYDGVKASMHAITNARPVAYGVGEFAVGAGLGAAGSKQAVAVGGAYRFNEQWAGSFTLNHETEGRHTKADTSAGIGAQFSFK